MRNEIVSNPAAEKENKKRGTRFAFENIIYNFINFARVFRRNTADPLIVA